MKKYELPNQYLVNGALVNETLQNNTGIYVYNLTSQINKITMKWDKPITNCNYMFYDN